MGFLFLQKGFCIWVCLCALCFISVNSESGTVGGIVFIEGKSAIGRTDTDFICATLDWWPPEKCDYGTCSWGHASLLNLIRGAVVHPMQCVGLLSISSINAPNYKQTLPREKNLFGPLKTFLDGYDAALHSVLHGGAVVRPRVHKTLSRGVCGDYLGAAPYEVRITRNPRVADQT